MSDLIAFLRRCTDEDERAAMAEVDAKRAILDLHAEPHECPAWSDDLGTTSTGYYGPLDPCPTVLAMVQPYTGRSR